MFFPHWTPAGLFCFCMREGGDAIPTFAPEPRAQERSVNNGRRHVRNLVPLRRRNFDPPDPLWGLRQLLAKILPWNERPSGNRKQLNGDLTLAEVSRCPMIHEGPPANVVARPSECAAWPL